MNFLHDGLSMHAPVVLRVLLASEEAAFSPTSYRRCAETVTRLERYLGHEPTLGDLENESLERLFGSMAGKVSSLIVKRDRRLLLKLRALATAEQQSFGQPDACGA
jgi:hypothetical protein